MGKPGFPIPLPVGMPAAPNSGWEMGKPGFPIPLPVGMPAAPNSGWEMGKPGFPNPSLWGGARFPLCRLAIVELSEARARHAPVCGGALSLGIIQGARRDTRS